LYVYKHNQEDNATALKEKEDNATKLAMESNVAKERP
jgi:hypothetical protein